MTQRLGRNMVEQKAVALLSECGITKPPVDVERIARKVGYEVVFLHYENDVSGTVMMNPDGTLTIGINTFHAPVRQRFSIAHEIGHARLHASSLKTRPFVDPPARVLFRDGTSSLGEDPQEIQANQYAAGLLMPAAFVQSVGQRLIDRNQSIAVDDFVSTLADRFEVSEQAMRYRLVTFGVLEPR
jgi:Zn-dependent peptidase ImmA (M78 family)